MPALLEDLAVTCTLLQILVAGRFFKSPACIGPVPTLFSKDPEATTAWLKEDKQAVQGELLVNSPRAGRFRKPLLRAIPAAEPAAKKQKVDQPPLSSSHDSQQTAQGISVC